MSRFGVFIADPPDGHWRGLVEVARGVAVSLRQLGHEVEFVPVEKSVRTLDAARPIIFNAHRMLDAPPADAIIYNAEQVPAGPYADDPVTMASWAPYLSALRSHVVWDYSATNIERLRALGCERVAHCPVGYYPQEPIAPAAVEDVDVLFVGSMNERRAMLMYDLGAAGLKIKTLFGVYGEERDRWIARSKVALNVHFYPNPVFEIFRCAHLFANKKCVVTESGGCDPDLERLAREACAYVPYKQIVETCRALVADEELRSAYAVRGHEAHAAIDQLVCVREALGASL